MELPFAGMRAGRLGAHFARPKAALGPIEGVRAAIACGGRGRVGDCSPGVCMRTRLLVAVLLLSCPSIGEAAPQFPDPAGCANYREIKTGVADSECDAAIASETDPRAKSMMLFRRAYIKDATGNFANYDSAIADLTEAIRLAPDNSAAFHERGYIEIELGEADKAAADLDMSIKLAPDEPSGYDERALARFMLGDLQGQLEDRDQALKLAPGDFVRLVVRARSLMWLGRFDDASLDIQKAEDIAKESGDAERLKSIDELDKDFKRWTTKSDNADEGRRACIDARQESDFLKGTFIGDCTRAFLTAATNGEKAEALTNRASGLELWKQSRAAALDDARIAAAIDPANPDWQFNLGSWLVAVGRDREALPHLELAIAKKPTSFAYATRAEANYDLGDARAAFADAKKSVEIEPNELALTVLGDLVYEKLKDQKAAAEYWLDAYSLGDRDDGLKARLAKVGVSWPPSPNLLAAPSKPGNPK
jgi:tetratricopeptide (TPR) repeat protein